MTIDLICWLVAAFAASIAVVVAYRAGVEKGRWLGYELAKAEQELHDALPAAYVPTDAEETPNE